MSMVIVVCLSVVLMIYAFNIECTAQLQGTGTTIDFVATLVSTLLRARFLIC